MELQVEYGAQTTLLGVWNQADIKISFKTLKIIIIKCQICEHPNIDQKLFLETDE